MIYAGNSPETKTRFHMVGLRSHKLGRRVSETWQAVKAQVQASLFRLSDYCRIDQEVLSR